MFEKIEQIDIPEREQVLELQKDQGKEKKLGGDTENKNLSSEDETEKTDPIKNRLLKFLEEEKILQKIDDYTVFDQTKLNDTQFIRRSLGHLYLGRKKDSKQLMGSKKIIFEKLADLEIVPMEDYLAKKERGEKIIPIKFSGIMSPPDLNNEEIKTEVRDHILEFLEKNDVLKIIGNLNVMDIAKLRDREVYNHITNKEFLTRDKRNFCGGQMLLFETLSDLEVISKEDFQETIKNRANIKTKPLFNVPSGF